jgi:putative flippase GtrA
VTGSEAPSNPGPSGPPGIGRAGLWPELVRFGIVGLLNTAFGYGVFILLQLTLGTVAHYLVVLAVANVVAILQAYVFQRRLVFRFQGGWWAGLLRFSLVYVGAFAVNLVLLPVFHELLRIPVIPAQGIVTVLQAFGTYVAHSRFTFGPASPPADRPQADRSAPVEAANSTADGGLLPGQDPAGE